MDPIGCAAALAGLPGMGPPRLRVLLADQSPETAWADVCQGAEGDLWRRVAEKIDVEEVALAHERAGIEVLVLGDPTYPAALAEDPAAPAVLFSTGRLDVVTRPMVGIVGARRGSPVGRQTAFALGRALPQAGVNVVSGMALGVDRSAVDGYLSTEESRGPVAVVGHGLDLVYPRRNLDLWPPVRQRGVLLSEWPMGTRPEPWRLPARDRIIGALVDLLVCIDSHASDGLLKTVEAAEARGRRILAVHGTAAEETICAVLAALGLPHPVPGRET